MLRTSQKKNMLSKNMVVDSIVVDEEVDEVAAHRSLNPTELDICKHAPFLAYVTIVASFGKIT